MKKRDGTIDTMKGIGIILVILGHAIQNNYVPLNKVILSFHMPLFFFVSGMLFCPIKQGGGYREYAVKKIKALMLPQIVLGALLAIFEVVILCLALHRKNLDNIYFIECFTQWFLIVMLYVVLIFPLIQRHIDWRNRKVIACYIIVVVSIAALSAFLHVDTVLSLEKTPMALLFYSLGYLVNQNGYRNKINTAMNRCWIFLIPALIFLAEINAPIGMYENCYGNLFLFMLTSFMGISLCMYFSEIIKHNDWLELFGKYSIVVYCTHFVLVKFFRLVLNFILPDNVDTGVYPIYFVLFLIVLCLESIFIDLWDKGVKQKRM